MVDIQIGRQIETFEPPTQEFLERQKQEEKTKEKKLTKNQKKVLENEGINELQKQVVTNLLLKERDVATELIVNRIEQENFIYTTKDDIKSEMWIYDEGIYIPQGKSFIREFCRKVLGKAYTIPLANEVISKIEADTYINHDEFFRTNYPLEIPLANGILNITTKKLFPFNHRKIFFNKLNVKYNPKAKCPAIEKFFKDVLRNEEDIKVMFEIFGYCLLKEYKFEKAFMFLGSGRNGKGKTLSLLKRFVGADNCCSVPLSQINAISTSVAELHGRMVNIAGDLNNTDLKDTGTFKQITGRDLITAKRKYLRDLFFVNYAKLLFACNELPRVYDFSQGFWSRWILLEFPYQFLSKEELKKLPDNQKEQCKLRDEEIIDKIIGEEEMSGLLNEALIGLDRLIEQRDFSFTKGTAEVKDMWIRQSDSFTSFCMDNIVEDYNASVSKKDLRRFFSKYCKKHKIKGASDKGIKATLEDVYGVIESQIDGERYWEGIRLTNSGTL